MKKEQIIFNEISGLNPTLSHSSSLGSYVSDSEKMVSDYIFKKVIKIVPENSLAYKILTSTDHFSEKQLWVITFELSKNEKYSNEIMEEYNERISKSNTRKDFEKSKKQENKENSKNILEEVKKNGKKLSEYYSFLKGNKNFRKEYYSQKYSIESVNAFLAN